MKTQSINLYNKLIDPSFKNNVLNLRQIMILNGILAVIMLILFSVQLIHISFIKKKNAQLTTDIAIMESEFYRQKKQYPQIFFTGNTEKSIDAKSKELEAHKNLLDNISNYNELEDYLTTFSKIIVKNVWINSINITKGGDMINISGQSLTNTPMNTFFENIINNNEFVHYTLNINQVDKDSKTQTVNFEIELKKRSL